MGVGFQSSFCSCSNDTSVEPQKNMPNPTNFKIKSVKHNTWYTLAEVEYPDATNFEGTKLLLFFGYITEKMFIDKQVLDPHFCDGDHWAPCARFSPNSDGRRLAKIIMESEK